jgi:hypothetical protein
MNTKDLIIQEINQLPEALLPKVLESIQQLREQDNSDRVRQAYLESEQENQEVYQRLANS